MRYTIIALALLAASCSKKPAPPEPEASQPEAETVTETSAEGTTKPMPVTKVELLAPGNPPHRALRYSFKKGQKATVEVTTALVFQTELEAVEPGERTVAERVVQTIALEVTSVAEDGSAQVAFQITGAKTLETEGAMPEKTAIATSEGATGSYELAPSGAIRNITIAPPHDKMHPDGIRDMIRATAHGLPAEPVGVGATWRVEEVLPRQKYPVTVSSTVKLLALKWDQIELRFESEVQGSATVETAGRTQQMSTASTARGTTAASLRELAPESAEIQESIKDRVEQDQQAEGPKWLEITVEQTKTVRRL